ncbi:MAG: hypothetical protein M0042_08940 [Nitrospiraceae bacterium]|nr:hypothetical protein [Nitrospiraceae bacterium]
MKRGLIAVLVVMVCLVSGAAFASEGGSEKGLEVEAGVKAWYNKWKSDVPGAGSTTFDSTLLIGPAVEVMCPRHFYFEASYLFSVADYEHSEAGVTEKFDRKDLDLAVGYQFIPQAGVYVGYKKVSMGGEGVSSDLTGPMIGIRGNVPVSHMFAVYGNLTYLMTKVEVTGAPKEDAPGTVIELGVKAEVAKKVSANLGYKIETTKGDDSKIKDTFSGITLGAMYAF